MRRSYKKEEEGYITFSLHEGEINPVTIVLKNYNGNNPYLEFSWDAINWTQWKLPKQVPGQIEQGQTLYVRGKNPTGFSKSGSISTTLLTSSTYTGKLDANGNIMCLLDYENPRGVTLTDYCFKGLFANCSSLITAPKFPATVLARYCYQSAFYNCSHLAKSPDLPARELAEFCYNEMFNGCTRLQYVKCLASINITHNNCLGWFTKAPSSGTFVKAAGATWELGASGIPEGWDVVEV